LEEGRSLDDVLSFSLVESEEVVKAAGDSNMAGVICSCGHAARYHKTPKGEPEFCLVGRQPCRCDVYRPVLKVPDARYFMRKSQGNGNLHALSLGIAAARLAKPEQASEMKWNKELSCMKCKKVDVAVSPTMLSLEKVILTDPDIVSKPGVKIHNLLLCDTCVDDLSTLQGV
jgi:hypothetical protein